MIQTSKVTHGVVHFSAKFPVEQTACGKLGPSAGRWRYVDCLDCLERAPKDPRVEERRREVLEERRRRENPSEEG